MCDASRVGVVIGVATVELSIVVSCVGVFARSYTGNLLCRCCILNPPPVTNGNLLLLVAPQDNKIRKISVEIYENVNNPKHSLREILCMVIIDIVINTLLGRQILQGTMLLFQVATTAGARSSISPKLCTLIENDV